MEFTAGQIAELLNGAVDGDPEIKVSSLSKIEEGIPGSLSFLSNPKYTAYLYSTQASLVIVDQDFTPEAAHDATLIRVPSARNAFGVLLEFYDKAMNTREGIHPRSYVSESATLGTNCYVAAGAVIEDGAQIGNNVQIYPNVTVDRNVTIGDGSIIYSGAQIKHSVVIGNNCTVHEGAVVGSDGFGFAPQEDGSFKKVPQIGNVVLEDNVDIGALATIDRATLGSTLIKRGAKVDNQVQIAHNVVVGENTVIAAQTGVAGSSKIGRNCQIGGQVGIAGHLTIGDGVRIQAQSGIASKLKDNAVVQGSPAFSLRDYMKSYVHFKNLQSLRDDVETLKKTLNA